MRRLQGIWEQLVRPQAADEDLARQEYMTRVILTLTGSGLAACTGLVALGFVVGVFDLAALATICLMDLFIAASWWLTVHGHWQQARYVPPLLFFLLGVLGTCETAPQPPLLLAYALAIALAAMLLGTRAQWLVAGLSGLAHLGIGQWLRPLALNDFLSQAVAVAGLLAGLALLEWFALYLLQTALVKERAQNARLQIEVAERQRAEADLRALNETLEDRVAARTAELSELNAQLRREVAERQRTEIALQATVGEKEVLLKEIHHRVKNNLQVVSSLLALQAKQLAGNQEAEAAFRDSQHRVRSMALIHEKLYQSQNLAEVDLSDYIRHLATSMVRSYQRGGDVTLQMDLEAVALGVDQAVPCGLIVNELITNALKYACPFGRRSTLNIHLHPGPAGTVELRVADDGPGLPPGLDIHQAPSLGFQLIIGLVGQLRGTVEVTSGSGAAFRIAFPYPG